MAFPSVVQRGSARTAATNSLSHAITIPAHVAGDLLLVHFACNGGPRTFTPVESGWLESGNASNTTIVTGTIFGKIAQSAAETLTLGISSTEQSSHTVLVIRPGAGQTLAWEVAVADGSSTNSDPPALTPSGGNQDYLWITTRAGDSTVVATAAPASFTNLQTLAAAGTGGASTNTAEQNLAGTTLDPGVFTSALEQWVSQTVAVWEIPNTGGTPWTVQPPPDTPIDTANPLAAGLFFAFSGADTYGSGVARNTTPVTTAEGISASATTTSYTNADTITDLAAPVTSSEWTLATVFSSPTPAGAYEVIWGIVGTSDTNRIHQANRIFSTSNLGLDARPYAADRNSATVAPGPDVFFSLITTIGADVRIYLDGVLIYTGANDSVGNALEFDRVQFFRKTTNGDTCTIGAKILAAQAYSNAKTATEVADLAANPWQVYTPDAGGGPIVLTPPLLDNSAELFAPSVTTGAVILTPPLLDNTAALFAPAIVQIDPGVQAVSFPLLNSLATLFVPTVTTGAVSLTPPVLDSSATPFAPTVAAGAVPLTMPLLDSGATLFAPVITQGAPGEQMITPPLLDSSAVLFVPFITQSAPPDETAPVLSSPTGVAVGSAAGAGTVVTDEANGTLYWVTTINAAELEATVLAGLSQSVVGSGVQSTYTPGLTAETGYYNHFVHVDAAGNSSTVVSSGQFTTTAAPASGQGSSSRMSMGLRIGL